MRPTLVATAAALVVGAGCSLLTDLSGYAEPPRGDDAGAEAASDGSPRPADSGATPFDAASAPDGGGAYVAAVLADAPIAYYPLEETGGTTAKDVLGGKDAQWVGPVKLGVPGKVGSGALFDGEATRLELPTGAFGFGGNVPYSVEVWLRSDIGDGQVRFVLDQGRSAAGSGGYTIYFNEDFFLCSRKDGDGGSDGYSNIPPPPVGRLVHLVYTYDGSKARLYVDGVNSQVGNGPGAIPAYADGRVVFGDSVGGQFFKLKGLLDEIAFYDAALPEARVQAHFAAAPR